MTDPAKGLFPSSSTGLYRERSDKKHRHAVLVDRKAVSIIENLRSGKKWSEVICCRLTAESPDAGDFRCCILRQEVLRQWH